MRTFWKKNCRFSQENPIFECYEESHPKTPLETLFKKLGHVQPLWQNVGSFRKNHLCSKENLNSERFRFENFEAKALIGTPPRTNVKSVSVFLKNQAFFKRPFCFSRKEKKLESPEKFWAFLPLECWKIILQKLCQLKRFWKLWNIFPKTTHVILQ